MSTVGGISASIIIKMFHFMFNIIVIFYTTNTMTVQRVEELCGEGGVVDFSYM